MVETLSVLLVVTLLLLPFTRKTCHSMQLYERLVCFVMAYSFTDGDEQDQCQRTMMVPFVDLLNHHSHHHVELRFQRKHLELMAVRRIRKVWSSGEESSLIDGFLTSPSLHTG